MLAAGVFANEVEDELHDARSLYDFDR